MRHALVLALLLVATSAHADIVPSGHHYVSVSHTLSGSATLTGYTLVLVTTSAMRRDYAEVSAAVGDGPLVVPSGYMNRSQLVALTPAQKAELDQLVKESPPTPDGERGAPSPLRAFFDRKDVAASDTLPFRELLDDSDSRKSVSYAWTVGKVEGGHLNLTRASEPEHAAPLLPITFGGAGVVLGVALLARRRRVARPVAA